MTFILRFKLIFQLFCDFSTQKLSAISAQISTVQLRASSAAPSQSDIVHFDQLQRSRKSVGEQIEAHQKTRQKVSFVAENYFLKRKYSILKLK